jgi:hypothetical protein
VADHDVTEAADAGVDHGVEPNRTRPTVPATTAGGHGVGS